MARGPGDGVEKARLHDPVPAKRKCRRITSLQTPAPNPCTAICVAGHCRRSASAVSVYATYATYATICSPFPFYPVLSSCYGHLQFSVLDTGGATFILPIALPANAKGAHRPRKPPLYRYSVHLYLYSVHTIQRFLGNFQSHFSGVGEVLTDNSASFFVPRRATGGSLRQPTFQPLVPKPALR